VPRPNSSRRSVAVLRWFGFLVSVALAVVGVYLVVTSTNDPKRIEIGVLFGLWGALVGAIVVFGSRSREPAPAPNPIPVVAPPGQELDLRKIGEIERLAIANAVDTARREFRAELEEMLRREVQAGLAQEVAGLRAEVAALRNELVEKVGGQLRLERIETTRLIGSDLEALQHELRQLREIGAREPEPAAEVHEAEIVVERVVPPAPPPPPAAAPEPVVEPAPQREPEPEREPEPAMQATADLRKVVSALAPDVAVQRPAPEPAPVVQRAAEPKSQPAPEPVVERAPEPAAPSADPFASLPRIRPFTDFELDPIPAPVESDEIAAHPGRHASSADQPAARGRRHRADDDDPNDMLARILARESRH
jgi:outer membrane biosynthesis protein TonB